MKRNQYRTRDVFIETNGPGPWTCSFCGEQVEVLGRRRYDGNIHHIDEDKTNDDPNNLVVMHVLCHQRHHNAGKSVSEETRAKMSIASSGRIFSDEHRAKISSSKIGKKPPPFTEEHRRRIGAAHLGMKRSAKARQRMSDAQRSMPRFRCGDCPLTTTKSALFKHQKATGHVGKVET